MNAAVLRVSFAGPNDYVLDGPAPPPDNIGGRSCSIALTAPAPMNGEAEVKFLDGDFRVLRPGAFVRCAVTGVPIPLEELKYWSVDLQEAYASPEAVLQRHQARRGK